MSFSCNFCGKSFKKGTSLGGHVPRCKENPNFTPKEKIKIERSHDCKYCGKSFDNGWKLGGHIVTCIKNPSSKKTRDKIAESHSGKTLSKSHRDKISKTVFNKIENGEWHNSFSKSKTYEYKGQKFHGSWEIRYAKYLDSKKIKWRRPNEKFSYEFNGKTRYYTPDFYLLESNEYIEIKGYETDKDRAKWKSFPLKLRIIKGKQLRDLKIIDHYKDI